jgi:hypothetical protein
MAGQLFCDALSAGRDVVQAGGLVGGGASVLQRHRRLVVQAAVREGDAEGPPDALQVRQRLEPADAQQQVPQRRAGLRKISYLRRHELNSVVRVGVLRQPSPLLRHLLLGFSWPQALAYLQCIGRALYIVFPYCHLDHEPPMALKDGSAHTDQTTSLDHVTPCAG